MEEAGEPSAVACIRWRQQTLTARRAADEVDLLPLLDRLPQSMLELFQYVFSV